MLRDSIDEKDQRTARSTSRKRRHKSSRKKSRSKSPRPSDNTTDIENTYDLKERPPYHALIKESVMLGNWQVTLTYLSFMLSVSLYTFPHYSQKYGIFNGFMANVIVVLILIKTNQNLIKSIPVNLMRQNLTYGQIVGGIFGRVSYKHVMDVLIIMCSSLNYILYVKFLAI